MNLLINLPPSFFTIPGLKPYFSLFEVLASEVHFTSHDTLEELMGDLPWAEAVLMWAWPDFTEKDLAQCPVLKFVGQINTTQQHVRACLSRGIVLSEVRHCWSPAVAELALALILSGLRQTNAYHIAMRSGTEDWIKDFPADINPLERQLTGLPVGIVGFGAIGQRLAQLLAPFNVRLRVYDPFLPPEIAAQYNAQPVPMLELVRESDVVALCAANSAGARRVLGAQEISLLRPNTVLVNVARSMLVDMEALQERLFKGDLIAMLDVYDQEPLDKESPLRTLPNTYLTPHTAGGIMESVERALTMLGDDLEAFQKGSPCKYQVTESMLVNFR
jgi:D-3-phosphoglycerate dehydrogenase / 2-oxoglutarate reductase